MSDRHIGRIRRGAYTLIEVLMVVALIVLFMGVTIPAVRSIREASGRASALNTINAALQGARSYAIMYKVRAAARFQPNGRIFLVWRLDENAGGGAGVLARDWDNNTIPSYPDGLHPWPNRYIYLPVVDRDPLALPLSYRVADLRTVNGAGWSFAEPFYVCYKPDGTLVAEEPIFVATVDDVSAPTPRPVNIDFNGDGRFAFDGSSWPAGGVPYQLDQWADNWSVDVSKFDDLADQKLLRYYLTATTANDVQFINSDDDGVDHYGGYMAASGYAPRATSITSVSQFILFATPQNWHSLPLYTTAGGGQDDFVAGMTPKDYEVIQLNPYTGRMLRSLE